MTAPGPGATADQQRVNESVPAKPTATARASGHSPMVRALLLIAGPLLFLVVWEILGQSNLIGNGLFPPFSTTMEALTDWLFGTGQSLYSGQWVAATLASLARIAVGFGVGSLLAVALGVLTGRIKAMGYLFDPTVNFIRPISIVAWVPLALVVFGIGDQPAIFLTALATFFPVYVATVSGVRYTPRGLISAARMLGARESDLMRRVVLPAALPSIATGLRVGLGIAWTTVIVAEMLGAKSGLGYTLYDSYQQFQTQFVTAGMISIGILGFLCDRLLILVTKPVLRWTEGADDHE